MFFDKFKSIAAATVLAAATSFTSVAPVNAGTSFSLQIGGGGHHGYHGGYHGGNTGLVHGRHHSGPRFRGHRKYHNKRRHAGFCHPKQALNKAWKLGLNRPHIDRINEKAIAVVGWHHGYRAKVVFAKHTNHCKVIKTRGF